MTTTVERIDTLRERIRTSDHISEADKGALITMSEEMEFLDARYSDRRHLKLLQHCTLLAGDSPNKYDPDELPDVNLVDCFEDEHAVKTVGRWIARNYDSEETKRDYRVAVRMFGEHATPGGDIPEPVKLLSADTPSNYKPRPDPGKMLRWEEHILPMVEAAPHLRDQAAITVAWDAGARPEEFLNLKVGDVSDHNRGMRISVDGKRGERSVMLITSVPYLQRWLSVHPGRDEPDAPLWCKLNSPDPISYRMGLKMIKKPAREAGIDHTDITYRRMRKSSASHVASQNVSQSNIENRYGWKRGSDVAARYIAVFDEANDREIARAYGADVEEDEPDPIAPLTCPRCQRNTPRNEPNCVWCGQSMDHKAVEQIEDEQRETRAQLLALAQDDPEFLDDIERLERFIEFTDSNPEVVREAREFVETTGN